jgi:ATP-dependent Clp protease ATP-binding subunit ClpA
VPKINVYLPDDLATAVREAGIPVSSICQQALADAVAAADGPEPSAQVPGDLTRLTKRARRAIELATAAAGEQHREPTTAHLVGGLLGEGGNLALAVLGTLDVDPDDLVSELRGLARGRRTVTAGPLDAVLARAAEQSRALGHNYIGCEHLLLGLATGPEDELTAATLHAMGVTPEAATRAVTTALAGYAYARENLSFSGLSAPIRSALEDLRQRLARLETRV